MRYLRHRLAEDPNQQQLYDIRHRLPRVTVPICIIWGGVDRFAPLEMGYKVRDLLPTAEFHVLKNSGHQCMNDEVEAFNDIAIGFLKG